MNRTPDLLITNELLYRLSYTGVVVRDFSDETPQLWCQAVENSHTAIDPCDPHPYLSDDPLYPTTTRQTILAQAIGATTPVYA